ncbi:MAG TPA: isochorismatase family protein [Acidimicrobiales bacterium]
MEAAPWGPTALVTIDVQVDTLDGQPLEIGGTSAALPRMAELCTRFRSAQRPIVHVVRLYLADGSNAETSRQSLVRGPVPILRPGTPGRMIAPELVPSAASDLDDDLLLAGGIQELGPSEVANCPRTSMYEASERDYGVVLVDDAISGLYDRGRQELTGIGVECRPTQAILDRVG